MATMKELSRDYRAAAIRLRIAIEDRQMKLKEMDIPDSQILREIQLLKTMLLEMRDLKCLTETYYIRPKDPKYTTNGLRAPRVNSLR